MLLPRRILGFSVHDPPTTNVVQYGDGFWTKCAHEWYIILWGTRGVLEKCSLCSLRRFTERGVGVPCGHCGEMQVDTRLENIPDALPVRDDATTYVCPNERCEGKHRMAVKVYPVLNIP